MDSPSSRRGDKEGHEVTHTQSLIYGIRTHSHGVETSCGHVQSHDQTHTQERPVKSSGCGTDTLGFDWVAKQPITRPSGPE